MRGDEMPRVHGPVPGPRSRALADRLARVESRNVTARNDAGPIFWTEATGAVVRDVDDNVYIDLTAGFGVAAAGHGNPLVGRAVAEQFGRLAHAMGDVHPADVKVELLERLAALAPGDLGVSILSANGSDAVESALKTALLATGRAGVVAFRGGYHGLGYGSLSVTAMERFRDPFSRQLYGGVRFASFPGEGDDPAAALAEVRAEVAAADGGEHAIGAVIVEPIQGRGGIIVPPASFLPGLRSLCDELGLVLILDEVYTGLGRTGRWFACEHTGTVPDLLVLGKSLAGGLPLSAVVGTPAIMDAWPASDGEALHTSTFLGNPVTAAAALAHLREIEEQGLVARAAELGDRLGRRLDAWARERPWAAGSRGLGLMRALVLDAPDAGGLGGAAMATALREGIVILPEGDALAFTPPLVITEAQLDRALDVVERVLDRLWSGGEEGQ
jgi:4-aminobutyrate aminotransferase/(S)-3-amino-2-methylpropionate transaminase